MYPGPHASTWDQMTRTQIAAASADRTLQRAFAPRRQFAPGRSRLDQSQRTVRLGDGRTMAYIMTLLVGLRGFADPPELPEALKLIRSPETALP